MKVLIVEDDDNTAFSLDHLMREYGCESYVVKKVYDAMIILGQNNIDIILLDYWLEGEYGSWDNYLWKEG